MVLIFTLRLIKFRLICCVGYRFLTIALEGPRSRSPRKLNYMCTHIFQEIKNTFPYMFFLKKCIITSHVISQLPENNSQLHPSRFPTTQICNDALFVL